MYVYVVVQFHPWFKTDVMSLCFTTHYHTLPYLKTKGNRIETKNKIEPQHI